MKRKFKKYKPIRFEAIGCKCTQPHCYNGHAFLTLGDIPELNTPTYASLILLTLNNETKI